MFDFVSQYFEVDFRAALEKIDRDFNLGIVNGEDFETTRQAYYKSMARQAEREREQFEREQADAKYWAAFDEWKRYDDNMRNFAPKSEFDEWDDRFVEAAHNLPYASFLLDLAEAERGQKL